MTISKDAIFAAANEYNVRRIKADKLFAEAEHNFNANEQAQNIAVQVDLMVYTFALLGIKNEVLSLAKQLRNQ